MSIHCAILYSIPHGRNNTFFLEDQQKGVARGMDALSEQVPETSTGTIEWVKQGRAMWLDTSFGNTDSLGWLWNQTWICYIKQDCTGLYLGYKPKSEEHLGSSIQSCSNLHSNFHEDMCMWGTRNGTPMGKIGRVNHEAPLIKSCGSHVMEILFRKQRYIGIQGIWEADTN